VQGCCEHGNEPSDSISNKKYLRILATGSFSIRTGLHIISYIYIYIYIYIYRGDYFIILKGK
jgi:hypothetical protein